MRRFSPYQSFIFITLLGVLTISLPGCRKQLPESQRAHTSPEAYSLLQQTQTAIDRNDYLTAASLADSAAAKDPALPEIQFLRGVIYENLNRLSTARSAYEKVYALNPDYPGIHFYLGNIQFKFEQYRSALAHYQQAVETYQPSEEPYSKSRAYLNLGLTYARLEKPDSALMIYRQALTDDSTNAEAAIRIATAYREQGEMDDALHYALRALRVQPEDPDYQFQVGALYFQQGEMSRAVRYFEKTISQMPWNYRAQYQLGQALMRLGREEEARQHLARADTLKGQLAEIVKLEQKTRMEPSRMIHWFNLGKAYHEMGDESMAKESLLMALSIDPDNLVLLNNLGHICLQLQQPDESISYFRKILHADSSLSEVWLSLGLAYVQTNQLSEAREAWRQALAIHPGDPRAQAFLKQTGGL